MSNAVDKDMIATSYRVYPTGWFDACREIFLFEDRWSVSVSRSYRGGWLITHGYTHWSRTKGEWLETHNGYAAPLPLAEDHLPLDEALALARELVDKHEDFRGRTFADAVVAGREAKVRETEEEAIKAAKNKARREARAKKNAAAK